MIVLIVFPIGIYHRLQSQSTREPLDRRQEGLFILATLRPIGILLMVAVMSYLISPASMAWSSMPLPPWLRWIGVVLATMAGGLLLWAFRRLGKNLTDTVVTRREHTLVTQGPYRWVRHPFYVSVTMFVLGTALIAANWFFLVVGSLVVALLILRTPREEERLLARFGDSYRAYRDRTGRFVPNIRTAAKQRDV